MNKSIIFDERIDCKRIKLIGKDKVFLGAYTKEEAIIMARSQEKNLIQISEVIEQDLKVAICIINEVKRHIYEQNKTKKTSKTQNTKELCIKTNIDLNDLIRKLDTIVEHAVEGEIIMLTIRNHRRGNTNIEEFISHYLNNQIKLDYRIIRRTARDVKFYLSRKKK